MNNQFRYEVTENNTLLIYLDNREDSAETPLIRQPRWPNGTSWSREEASAWAEVFIANYNDPSNGQLPGHSPEKPIIYVEQESEPQA